MATPSGSQRPSLEAVLDSPELVWGDVKTKADGPAGALPLTDEMLRHWPSGDLFSLSQNAGMGWEVHAVARDPFLILSTQGGLRAPDGTPIALGCHTGHPALCVPNSADPADREREMRVPRRYSHRPPPVAMVSRPRAASGRERSHPGLRAEPPGRSHAGQHRHPASLHTCGSPPPSSFS
jgi:hypothetical protein